VSTSTQGQAEYEIWRAAIPDWVCNVPGGDWADLPDAVKAGFAALAARDPHAEDAPPEVQFAPCPVEGHDGSHMQWRSGQWTCGHVLANSMVLGGVMEPHAEDGKTGAQLARDRLVGALQEFYLWIKPDHTQGITVFKVFGTVDDPELVADTLLAQLSANAAHADNDD